MTAEATLLVLLVVSALALLGASVLLVRKRRLCVALAQANADLALDVASAAARLELQDGEIGRLRTQRDAEVADLRAELARHESLASSMQALTRRVEDAWADATRAADGSSRIEGHLLAFTRRIASPQSRGAFGEDTLRNQLEVLGFREGRDFERQVKEHGGRRRVDYVLRLRRTLIAIDPKFAFDPELEGLVDALRAEDEARLEAFGKKLVRHAKELAKKEYWRTLERSPSFVLMYVPVEGALEALSALPGFGAEKFSAEHGVYVVTPLHLGTTLGVIADIAHAAKRDDETEELAKELITLDAELARLCDLLAREGRQLATVVGTHEAIQAALGPRGGVGRIAKRVRGFSRRLHKEPEIAWLKKPTPGDEAAANYRGHAESSDSGSDEGAG
jgi:DNA recombination protein RmuC